MPSSSAGISPVFKAGPTWIKDQRCTLVSLNVRVKIVLQATAIKAVITGEYG